MFFPTYMEMKKQLTTMQMVPRELFPYIQEDGYSSMVEGQLRLPSVECAYDVASGDGEVVETLTLEKRNQLPQGGSSHSYFSQLRYVQKRLLEFIRKRVVRLEKNTQC